MLKFGVEPTVAPSSNGLCKQSRISQAVSLFNEMIDKGYQPHLLVHNTILNDCIKRTGRGILIEQIGQQKQATWLLNEMADNNISLNIVMYNLD
ncbi:hypothetical protein V6N11_031275 [Hibiscus sabdariffa]|uniref:Pentatricopeptide repeat-containing protein n=1 Tax=Hibiscus sabdariffa TaxID=183260 RepID=A0ABR2SX56_9ROSI